MGDQQVEEVIVAGAMGLLQNGAAQHLLCGDPAAASLLLFTHPKIRSNQVDQLCAAASSVVDIWTNAWLILSAQ